MPAWIALALFFAALAAAAWAAWSAAQVRQMAQRGSLAGIRRHLDDQDEVIQGLRRAWAQASEELTGHVESMAAERQKAQAANARAAKAQKRAQGENGDDGVSDFEEYRKRVLGAHRLGGD